jgi:hypothetical protein
MAGQKSRQEEVSMKKILVLLALCAVTLAGACGKKEQATAAHSSPGGSASSSAGVPGGTEGLVSDQALVDGTLVDVSHSKWDGGRSADLFDADPGTLARTEHANPAIIALRLPEPRPLKGVSLTTGGMDAGLTVIVQPKGGAPKTYTKEFRHQPADPTFGLDFDTGSTPIESVRIEIKDLNGGDGHIHIRTVKLL